MDRFVKALQIALKAKHYRWPFPKLFLTVTLALLVSVVILQVVSDPKQFKTEFGEQSFTEQYQRIMLLLAAIICASTIYRRRVFGIVFPQFFLLCASIGILSRETEFCAEPYRLTLDCAGTVLQPGITIAAIVVFLLFFAYCVWRRTTQTAVILHPRMSWPVAIILALAVAGQHLENIHLYVAEEVIEFASYFLLLLTSILTGFFMRDDQVP